MLKFNIVARGICNRAQILEMANCREKGIKSGSSGTYT